MARYHRDAIEFFDIGNQLELAERIMARPQFATAERELVFNTETNKAVYAAANLPGAGAAVRVQTIA